MRLIPTAEQLAFEQGVQRAIAAPADLAAQWQTLAGLGLTGLGLAEEFGGSGGGPDEIAIVARRLGEIGWRAPFAPTVAFTATALAMAEAPVWRDRQRAIAAGMLQASPVRAGDQAALVARRTPEGWTLSGFAPLVPGGAQAAALLVDAHDDAGERVALWVGCDQPGVAVEPVTVIDGAPDADIRLSDVAVRREDCLARGPAAGVALDAAAAVYEVARLWMAAAAVGRLVALTLEHLKTRQQFGQALAAFQSLQHRAARMSVLADEAGAAALFAQAEHAACAARRDRALSSAFVRISEIAEHVASEAVQLHGAIGFTRECAVSDHVAALFAFRHGGGGPDWHRRRLAAALRRPGEAGRSLAGGDGAAPGTGLSLALDADDESFRAEVRAFAEHALDAELLRGARLTVGVFPEPDVAGPWHKRLFARGWIAPHLPPEVGGTGWTALQAYLFDHACYAAGAPSLQLQGLRMLAPVLLRYGTPDQVARYLPHILSGDHLWCQGYSEPGAGSDLASLRTRAVADGDDYVVNGQKIWTTQAQHASHMFALVRTSTEGRRQDGISFLLIDMTTPGITVRPIQTLAGEQEVNEVFFDNVRVPRANLLGAENGGWECAKYLLDFERGGGAVSGNLRAYFARAIALVRDDALDQRIAATGAALDAIEMGELASIARAGSGAPNGVEASALKLRMAEVRQQIGAIAADALGQDALRWPSARPLHHQPPAAPALEQRMAVVSNHFNDLAYSIFAGSSEIQLSIIAGALGLRGARA